MQQLSTKLTRQRKFLMVLPLMVIPFLTLAFWALGGGKGTDSDTAKGVQSGLNLELPGAIFNGDKAIDKLGYYEKAASDSAKLQELIKNDPYFKKPDAGMDTLLMTGMDNHAFTANPYLVKPGSNNAYYNYKDPNETKVYQKLAQLNTALNEVPVDNKAMESPYPYSINQPALRSAEADRLEQMMEGMNNNAGNTDDAEMNQLNGMLEKILDIQHPERISEKLKEKSEVNKGNVFPVTSGMSKTIISLLDTGHQNSPGSSDVAFYQLSDEAASISTQNGIEARVHESQVLVNGAIIKIRLIDDVYVNGVLIPKDNFVYGNVALNNERLEVSIHSIRYGNSLFPVKLAVYDLDGLPGIHIPGAITRDVAKQSTDNALQSVALSSLDPSIGAQAASAGIETAKSLLIKKVRLVKVQVKAGYKILLIDNNQQ